MAITARDYYRLLVTAARDGTFPSFKDGKCLYRGPGNKRCAIGLLIPDDRYDPEDENISVKGLEYSLVDHILPQGMIKDDLVCIQKLHDAYASHWDEEKFIQKISELPCFIHLTETTSEVSL